MRSLLVIAVCALCSTAAAAPPTLVRTANYESVVRAEPDDLLLLTGSGFRRSDRVVYQAFDAPLRSTGHPESVPDDSTAQRGTAAVVQVGDPPYSLAIRMPEAIRADTAYRLWVVNEAGEWSEPVSINDPRPLWITPAYAYATADNANLRRRLRVVGRNLAPASRGFTEIKLSGPGEYRIRTSAEASAEATLARYVADAQLPERMTPGSYGVSLSRDGRTWTAVPDQQFVVRPDPAPLPHFELSDPDLGACRPDDGIDDGPCLARAIEAARLRSGGVVVIPPGRWDLGGKGFVLPRSVHLQGSGSQTSFIVRHGARSAAHPGALLTLTGSNSVTGISFTDEERYTQYRDARPLIQLGVPAPSGMAPDAVIGAQISDIVISGNVFRRVGRAVIDSGNPITRLLMTDNDFGAYADGLLLIGSRANVARPFRISDTVIRGNRFVPGSYVDITARQGAIASQLGSAYRVDFSANVADGTSTEALQDEDDPRGWRAGFFWSQNGDNELLLVADNDIRCPGDKVGDGEALAFDNNANTAAFDTAVSVVDAGRDWISVRAPLVAEQNGHQVNAAQYYEGHWIQLVEGPGVGQTRKIQSYAAVGPSGLVKFRIAPQWDVAPAAGATRVMIGRQYWHVYVVANRIDQRTPLCRKANLSGPHGGLISLWAPSADSVIEGNQQNDSDGIVIHAFYSARTASCPKCENTISFQSALEVRANVIEGEYEWNSDCSTSGILQSFGASPTPESPPPLLGFGVTITHNLISHADGYWGGAIDTAATWFRGPPPQNWPLIHSSIISHNLIRDITGSVPRNVCHYPQRMRTGIRLEGKGNIRDTVLYANRCEHVSQNVSDSGQRTARICASAEAGSCECTPR